MREVRFSKASEKFLKNLQKKDHATAKQIALKITALTLEPMPQSSLAIVENSDFRRIRVGKFRVIYRFDDEVLFVTLVDKRDKVYKMFC